MDIKSKENVSGEASTSDRYIIPVAVIAAILIIGAALYFGHGSAPVAPSGVVSSGSPSTHNAQAGINIKNIKTVVGNPYIGKLNAPVTMTVWFDYQCPFCKKLDEDTISKLYKNYVQTGKLRIVFKDFSFVGPDSTTDALFARAVWALYPNKFYEWNHAMFNAQDGENIGFGNLASVEKLTKTIPGIDEAKVVALRSQKKAKFLSEINADRLEGQALGINGTPSFIIGTHMYHGALPYAIVSAAINAQLKR